MREQTNRTPPSRPAAAEMVTATAALAGGLSLAQSAHAAGSDMVKIALIGCGGRGTGAAVNALTTKANVKLVAMADAFAIRLEGSLKAIQEKCKDSVDVPDERQFTGLDAYQKAIEAGVDMVLLCTPPGFRPMQFEAAVKAGKHVFMEKPVATDAPGVRRIMAANEEAKKKKAGRGRRPSPPPRSEAHARSIQRIHDGGHRADRSSCGSISTPAACGTSTAQARTRRKCSTRSATGTTSPGSAAITSSSSTSTTSTSATG